MGLVCIMLLSPELLPELFLVSAGLINSCFKIFAKNEKEKEQRLESNLWSLGPTIVDVCS